MTVVVELMARFDEASNIRWARELEDAGVQVYHGIFGFKTHCKLALLVRRDSDGELRSYAHLGTGNYNPATARFYTDISLLTARPELTEAVRRVFRYLTAEWDAGPEAYRPLMVAPITLATDFLGLIAREAEHAKAGRPARIIAKMNALIDLKTIDALYAASQAGVEIDLIVRGMCTLRPGIRGLSDRIRVRSIVGRFLEHSRIFWFQNGDSPEIFSGSADWMQRNLYERCEVVFPVVDEPSANRLRNEILEAYLRDDTEGAIDAARWQLCPRAAQRQRLLRAELAYGTRPSRGSGDIAADESELISRLAGHYLVHPGSVVRDAHLVGLVFVDKVPVVREVPGGIQPPHESDQGQLTVHLHQHRAALIAIPGHSLQRLRLALGLKPQLDPVAVGALDPRVGTVQVASIGRRRILADEAVSCGSLAEDLHHFISLVLTAVEQRGRNVGDRLLQFNHGDVIQVTLKEQERSRVARIVFPRRGLVAGMKHDARDGSRLAVDGDLLDALVRDGTRQSNDPGGRNQDAVSLDGKIDERRKLRGRHFVFIVGHVVPHDDRLRIEADEPQSSREQAR